MAQPDRSAPGLGRPDVLRGILLMCAGTAMFPFMNTAVKLLTVRYPVAEIVWARFTGHLIKTIRLMQAFGVPDTTREHVIEWVQGIVDGTVALPDHHARVPTAAATGGAEE